MGVMDDLANQGRQRVQMATSKSGLEPILAKLEQALAQQDQVLAQQAQIIQDLHEIPGKIEAGEEGRAERLRLMIQPTAKALIEGMQILHTEISIFRDAALKQEAETRELRAEVSALRQETASQREAMGALQDDMAAFRETSTPSLLSDLMVLLRSDLAESRERVSELLAASAELLTDLRESGPPGPTSHGEKKWSEPGRRNAESASLPLAVAWRIQLMEAERNHPARLQMLGQCHGQAQDMLPLGAGEDAVLATAWQILEENNQHRDPEWLLRMEQIKTTARKVLGLA